LISQPIRARKWYHELDSDPISVMGMIDVPVLLLHAERDPSIPIDASVS
jgi:hypothetical protein